MKPINTFRTIQMKFQFLVIFNTILLTSKLFGQDLLRQYESNVYYPIMNYESAWIEGGHTIGVHLPDYMALGSLKYTYSDTANFSLTIGMGLPSFQIGVQKHLFSVWNKPINLKLSSGIFINGFWADLKITNGIYFDERSNLSSMITCGKYWGGIGPVNFTDEKYIQLDGYYIFRYSRNLSFGIGLGSGICFYKDERDEQDTKDKVKPGDQSRSFWQGAINFRYIF